MRIVVPTVTPHPLAAAAVDRLAPTADRVDLGTRNDAYWQLLADLWSEGESFLVIEQDVEPTERALRQARSCPCPWGVVIASGPHGIEFDGSLSFTWFRGSFIAAEPDLLQAVVRYDGVSGDFKHWRQLDCRVYGVLRERGHKPHVHRPAVPHHHVYQGHCACGTDHQFGVDREGRYEACPSG